VAHLYNTTYARRNSLGVRRLWTEGGELQDQVAARLLVFIHYKSGLLDEERHPPKRQDSENKSVQLAMIALCRLAGPVS
jgi:hypothetical protein